MAGRRSSSPQLRRASSGGRLRIGDNWNAISIIALSQNNPLKAIAEFVENSIDARAAHITIVRGREGGEQYLRIVDDGEGIRTDDDGAPDYRHVATHICDSAKRKLKAEGVQGLQGEFGIGLLSFWTIGERLTLSSSGTDGRTWQMQMKKREPGYTVTQRRSLFGHRGTELEVRPLLPGVRQISGEKIQSYLASELRDRIRKSGVRITIKDRSARKELEVQPRQYAGRLLHGIGPVTTIHGEVAVELYLSDPAPENLVSLFRAGTRVLPSIAALDELSGAPWSTGYVQGAVDAPFVELTPGTRDGVVRDERYASLRDALLSIAPAVQAAIDQQRAAEEEETSRNVLKSVQRAFREALLALPPEDYDWFDLDARRRKKAQAGRQGSLLGDSAPGGDGEEGAGTPPTGEAGHEEPGPPHQRPGGEKEFYEYPGPLHSLIISPSSAVMGVGTEKAFRGIPRDRSRRTVEQGVEVHWRVKEGQAALSASRGEMVDLHAPEEPGFVVLEATAFQGEACCLAESLVTVTDSLALPGGDKEASSSSKGLPGYTFLRAPAELWRSRYDERNNLVVVNSGHRDFVYATQKHARKLRYICRLFAKELVLRNFQGFEPAALLEHLVELSLYTEEHLK